MNKKTKLKLNATLDKALEPPKRKNLNQLDALLSQYDSPESNAEPYPTLPHPTVVETTAPQYTLPEITVSPSKDFTKFSNSLLKQAIPDGLFRGQSKHTYDVLYLRTRGAVNPVREIQLTKNELVKLTGLEMKTIQRHLSFLREIGLITVDPKIGDHKGAIYAINIPEEMLSPDPTLLYPSIPYRGVNYTRDPGVVDTTVGYTNRLENKGLTGNPNTSLKTNTSDDDDTLRVFRENFAKISEEILGKNLSKNDQAQWGKLADLLILELKIAARRTDNISSIPAFLTEVLRRKLHDAPVGRKSKVKSDTVGKPENETYEIKPLDEKERKSALEQLREWAGDELLQDFRKWYTEDDWNWLTKELETE